MQIYLIGISVVIR